MNERGLYRLAKESGCLFPDRVAVIGKTAVHLGDKPEKVLAQIRRSQPQLWPRVGHYEIKPAYESFGT